MYSNTLFNLIFLNCLLGLLTVYLCKLLTAYVYSMWNTVLSQEKNESPVFTGPPVTKHLSYRPWKANGSMSAFP